MVDNTVDSIDQYMGLEMVRKLHLSVSEAAEIFLPRNFNECNGMIAWIHLQVSV